MTPKTNNQSATESQNNSGADNLISGNTKLTVGVLEAAQMLSVSPGSIRKLIRQRRLRRIEGFRKILVPVMALEQFVNESALVAA